VCQEALIILLAEVKIRHSKRGFTLIELILVTAIILVLVGLSTPLFERTFADLVIKSTTYNISKLIDYGWEKAVFQRKIFKMSFDSSHGKYQLLEMDDSVHPPQPPVYKAAKGMVGRVFMLPHGLSLKGSTNEIIFYPDGHCDEAKINVINGKGSGYTIFLNGRGTSLEIKGFSNEG